MCVYLRITRQHPSRYQLYLSVYPAVSICLSSCIYLYITEPRRERRWARRESAPFYPSTLLDGEARLCHMCARTLLHCSLLQCVAVCCSVLQCVAVCCSVLQRVTDGGVRLCHMCARTLLHYSLLQCVAVCCSVLQCVTVCCSVLQCVAVK